jgi:hypothetical protein
MGGSFSTFLSLMAHCSLSATNSATIHETAVPMSNISWVWDTFAHGTTVQNPCKKTLKSQSVYTVRRGSVPEVDYQHGDVESSSK